MKTKLFILSVIFILSSAFTQTQTVYICNSNKAYAYHIDRDCKGLKKCTHEVLTVSKSDAINKYGRRACGYCAR